MTQDELRQLIEQAAREGWKNLDLHNKKITKLPPEIGQLTYVEKLNLRRNNLNSLPLEVGQLFNLQQLDLRRNRLTKIPPEINQLINLKSIYLHGNRLVAMPSEISQLLSLIRLDIGGNKLTYIPPEIGKFANLEVLGLGGNQLRILPVEIGQLTNLRVLGLGGNQLTTIPPEIGKLSNLELLYLGGNQLTAIPLEIIQLTNLQLLTFRDNKLISVPPELGQLTKLQQFDLSGNQLTSVPLEIGQLTALQRLDLSGNQLTSVPPEIGQLTELQRLDLSGNQITSVPPEIGQLSSLKQFHFNHGLFATIPLEIGLLSNLQSLTLRSNPLRALPTEIGQLISLQRIDLSGNQLTSLPPDIGRLTSLQKLHLSGNQLTAVPPEIGQLSSLVSLYLGGNKLTDVPAEIGQLSHLQLCNFGGNRLTAVPPEIGQLSSLQNLYLNANRLTTLPPEIGQLVNLRCLDLRDNQFTRLPVALRHLKGLQELHLNENPLPIPPELLGSYRHPVDPQAILDAYFQASRPLREAKLLLVGEGSVGKTSLVERLLWNRPPSDSGKTIGVDIHPWELQMEIGSSEWTNDQGQMTTPDNRSPITDNRLQINVWDFGGQEIYHATHQFFLTHRSLYLLVIEARKDEAANRLDYWLRHVQSFAGKDAPLILVVNKSDQGRLALDERGLMLKYPAIRAIVHTSCTSGDGIPALRQAIETALAAMPHLNDHLPLTWFAVKEKLAALGKDTLPYENYVELCQAEGIYHEAAQRTLARFLHDLGAALNFQDDRRLAGTHVLNPEWVTGGIYTILTAPTLQERGLLRLPELDSILDRRRYPPEKHPYLLDIMHKFELCVPLSAGEQYLIPGMLPKERPAFDWPESGEPSLEYRYAILPAAILSRLMVRLHSHIGQAAGGQPIRWRNGLVLVRDGCRALVIADPAAARLSIALDGPAPHRRHLLAVIRAELDEIHASFAHLEAAEWVPIPGYPDKAIPYDDLLFYESQQEWTPLYAPIKGRIDVRVLLDGIESPDERDIRALVSRLVTQYNLAELRHLAFELDVNYEDLPHHTTQTEMARELAKYLQRRKRLPELAAMVKRR